MLPWKRIELLGCALIVGGSAMSDGLLLCAAANEAGSAGAPAVVATPLEQLKQESAQQRWQRLKTRYQPPLTESIAAEPAPLPEDAAPAAVPVSSAPPLPDDVDEPAWVLSSRPLPVVTPSAAPVARPMPLRQVESVEVPPAPRPTNIPVAAVQVDPPLPPTPTGPPSGDPSLEESRGRVGVRTMSEIDPYYDTSVDRDIREYANERAAEYDVKFGAEQFQPRAFPDTAMVWEPTNFYHFPLYFEDAPLERYGHKYPFPLQPFVSVAKFSGQLLAIPYQMTIDPPTKPMYALGWYRPGECAPHLLYQVPLNAQAAAVEAGVVTGLFFLIP